MAGMASSITVKYLYNNGYLNKFIVKLVKLLHVIASRAVLMSTRISPKNVASINDSSPLVLLSHECQAYDPDGRYYEFVYSNKSVLDNHTALQAIYKELFSSETFLNFGNNKVLMVHALLASQEYSFHHNVLINNSTTFQQYYDKVADHMEELFDEGYHVDSVEMFRVKVWNVDNLANKNIKITKDARTPVKLTPLQIRRIHMRLDKLAARDFITPLSIKERKVKPFYTMDVETVTNTISFMSRMVMGNKSLR